MKKRIFLLLLSFISIAQYIQAENDIRAYFQYATFCLPQKGPYVETYLSVMGNSIQYVKNKNKKFQGTIEISMIFKQNEEIKAANKYNLMSPEIEDTLTDITSFIDQQRFVLANGTYSLEINISDKNKGGKPFSSVQTITIDYPVQKVNISEIQLLESYKR